MTSLVFLGLIARTGYGALVSAKMVFANAFGVFALILVLGWLYLRSGSMPASIQPLRIAVGCEPRWLISSTHTDTGSTQPHRTKGISAATRRQYAR